MKGVCPLNERHSLNLRILSVAEVKELKDEPLEAVLVPQGPDSLRHVGVCFVGLISQSLLEPISELESSALKIMP